MKKAWFAYHVSNLVDSEDAHHINELNPCPANDDYYDRCLLGLPLVFASTTVRDGEFPLVSLYPTKGIIWTEENPVCYQRYKVALKTFDTCTAYRLRPIRGQIHIVLLPPEHQLVTYFDDLVATGDIFTLDLLNNDYLKKKVRKVAGENVTDWYVNEFGTNSKVFVNIAFPESLHVEYSDPVRRWESENMTNNASPIAPKALALKMWQEKRSLLGEVADLKRELERVKKLLAAAQVAAKKQVAAPAAAANKASTKRVAPKRPADESDSEEESLQS